VPETYLIAGGGTGGHLYPGIAIAEELKKRRPGARIVFAGRGLPLERAIVERHGYALVGIRSGGVVGRSLFGRLAGIGNAVRGFFEAGKVIDILKPRAVVGVGGYASFPMVLAAQARRVPTVVQDQNAVPGLSNRLLGRAARAIALTYDETRRYFGGRGTVTGNPIRAEFHAADRDRARRRRASGDARLHLFVVGGSQGSRALNDAVLAALPHLAERRGRLRIVHGTGPSDADRVRAAYAAAGFDATVLPYLEEIRAAYEDADLVVCRSGASTVSELQACGKAAILVPLPTSAHDHQKKNAEAASRAGAAVLLEQKDLTGEALAQEITRLLDDPGRLEAMERSAASLARPDAAARIVDLVQQVQAPHSGAEARA
jgi:UDP-N-acetylglucosamine--N-acetylmuramyl-(pentapeptide) pyrophosphoryl-undecaprenol N-acetylglucosamine transferase